MKRIIIVAMVLLPMLASLAGCIFYEGHDRDEGHERGERHEHEERHEERR